MLPTCGNLWANLDIFHMEATAAVAPASRDLQGRLPVTRSFNNSQAKEVKSDASRQTDQSLTFGTNAEDSKLQFALCVAVLQVNANECHSTLLPRR